MKLYWRFKKAGKWTFSAYEGFDDVFNLYTLVNNKPGTLDDYLQRDSAAAEMMLADYYRVLGMIQEEE